MNNKDILIVSGRYTATTFSSAENHRAYANKYGFSYVHCTWPGKYKNPYYNKIEYLLEHFDKYEYIFWIDDDAFFIDFDFDISELLPEGDALITICSSPKYKSIWTHISSGQFFMCCNSITKQFLLDVLNTDLNMVKDWWDESKYGYFTNGDQDAMVYLSETKYKNIFDIRSANLFNSRVDELDGSVNLLHITGTEKVKNKSLKLAKKILKRKNNLIPNEYLGTLTLFNQRNLVEKVESKICKKANVVTLDECQSPTSHQFQSMLDSHKEKFELVFNPCVFVSEKQYVCFRAKVGSEVRAYLKIDNSDLIDLTDYVQSYGVEKCADPKLFSHLGNVYVTFNTGYVHGEANAVYIMKVNDVMGAPLMCNYSNRQRIEKNWAFFTKDERLFCIYSISPFLCLEVTSWSEQEIVLDELITEGDSTISQSLTIGTQPLVKDGKLVIFAHQKFFERFKRLYLGKLLKIDIELHDNKIKLNGIDIHKCSIIHNTASLLGSKIKLNKNLLSCTYFSSLFRHGKDYYVGYGVNDVEAKIRKVTDIL